MNAEERHIAVIPYPPAGLRRRRGPLPDWKLKGAFDRRSAREIAKNAIADCEAGD
jgi:hypothetical protein